MISESLILITTGFLIATTSGAALHGQCTENEPCGTMDTYCRNGTCVCNENFIVFYDSCLQLPVPRQPCAHKSECKSSLGSRTLCKEGQCACRSFHHMYDGQCVKSRSLGDLCEADSQCYCGQSCLGRVACINEMCQCASGHKEENRRCIPNMMHRNIKESELVDLNSKDNVGSYLKSSSLLLLITITVTGRIL